MRRLRDIPLIAVVIAAAVAVSALSALGATAKRPATGHRPGPLAAKRADPGPPSWAVPHDRPGRVKPRPRLAATGPVPAGDEIITASADTGGYHLFAASSGVRWRWQPLATLQPAGYDGQRWIGEQCATSDGRYVVAVVAPWSAQNSAAGMAAGGIAYVIDAHTGKTRPLAAGAAATYFNPGCGLGSAAALTRFTPDQAHTQVPVADLRGGTVRALLMMPGELTSAIPAGRQVLAARGCQLLALSPTAARPVATVTGQVFCLRPNTADGADFLAVLSTVASATDAHAAAAPSGAAVAGSLARGDDHAFAAAAAFAVAPEARYPLEQRIWG